MQFSVTAECERETPLESTMHYGGSLGSGVYRPSAFNGGPSITISKDVSSVALAAATSAVVDEDVTFTVTTSGIGDGQIVTISGDGTGDATATVNGNTATFTRSFGSTGTKNVGVAYSGSAIAHPAGPAVASVEIGKIQSGISVSAAEPAMAGSPVLLTATTTGIPDGEPVEFSVSGQLVGTANVQNGTATFADWTPDVEGNYTIRAAFEGSATVAGAQSLQVGVTVSDPTQQTVTRLAVDPAPVPGQASTLTATVTDGRDGDTVEFSNYGQSLGTATLDGGVASIEWRPTAGQANQAYSLMAHYAGSTGYAASSSTADTGTVGRIQTTVSDVDAPATATVGKQIQLSATVTGGTEGEIIEFRDDETVLDTVSLSSGGVATAYWTPNATGEYNVTAHYPGTASTQPASSPSATTVTVGARESSIELTGPTSTSVGQAATLTATTAGIADGQTITFEIEGEENQTAQVSDGTASIQWTPTTAGDYNVRAVYAGSETVKGSESNVLAVVVGLGETQTSAVTASTDPVTGAAVTLTATVTDGTEGTTVEFRDADSDVLCTTQAGADGTATCEWTPEEIGDVAVTAHYLGDDTTSASDSAAATTVQVGQGTVAAPTELAVTPAAPTAADAVTVSGKAPAGSTVTVTAGDKECVVAAGADGSFSCDLGTLPVGQNQIQVVAALNERNSETASTTVEVGQASSSIELTGPASVQPNQPVQLELETTGIADGQSVSIVVNDVVHGTAMVSGGAATYPWTPTEAGTFTIRADYEGTETVEGTRSDELTVTVDALASQTSPVTASSTAASIGQPVTLSATVTGGAPGVDVQFRDGETVLCTGALAADGTVECEWEPTAAGTLNVTAHYPGDGASNPSQSARATTIEVGKTASSVALEATSPVTVNGQVTFTVRTTGIADGQTVEISVGGEMVASPTVSAGQATATWDAPATAGSVTAIAAYEGTDTVAGSESDPVTIDVGVAATSTSDVTASSGATAGQPVQLSATVTGGTEGVAVEFRDGATVLCSAAVGAGGSVECPWTPTTAGAVTVTAHYAGDATTGASESGNATTVTVAEAPDTEPPAAPTGVTVLPQPATEGQTVTVTGTAEADSAVSVMVDGVEVCEATATGGAFSCEFAAIEEMDGQQVTVTATDAAGNTSEAGSGGTLQVQPEAVDPTEPTITLTPAQPVAGETVEIEVIGDAGEEVVITDGDREVCRATLDQDGTATCEWTPDTDGQVVLKVTVGDQTVEKTVTVRPADDGGNDGGDDDDDDNDDGSGNGSIDMGSLGSLTGGAGGAGSSGSLGSLSSLGS